MARWAPGATARLAEAALALFAERGFSGVTVGEIAAAAGVTERTFFRHFATKEDVLFSQGSEIVALLAAALDGAPADAGPGELLAAAVAALAGWFEPDRELHRRRTAVIAADPALHERELLKQQAIAAGIVDRLRARGVPAERASVLAFTGLALFQTVYRGWVDDRARTSLATRLARAQRDLARDLAVPVSPS